MIHNVGTQDRLIRITLGLFFLIIGVKYGHYYPMGANSFHSRASGSSNWLNQFLPGI